MVDLLVPQSGYNNIWSIIFFNKFRSRKKIKFNTSIFVNGIILVKYCYFWFFAIYLFKLQLSLTDAFFESMSGITTTGSTIITNLNNSPKSIFLESNFTMVRWNWYYCNGNYINANNEYWRYAIIFSYHQAILQKNFT